MTGVSTYDLFLDDQLALDNPWIPGYDNSPEVLAKWVRRGMQAHEAFLQVLSGCSNKNISTNSDDWFASINNLSGAHIAAIETLSSIQKQTDWILTVSQPVQHAIAFLQNSGFSMDGIALWANVSTDTLQAMNAHTWSDEVSYIAK